MLQQLWQKNQLVFRKIAGRVVGDAATVDDVLQDAYFRLLRLNRRIDSGPDLFRFVRRVVWTTSLDYYRRRRRRVGVAAPCEWPFANPPSPWTVLQRQEEQRHFERLMREVDRVVSELPPKQRDALECFFGTSRGRIKDHCARTEVPYSTLRSRMLSALARIRRRLDEEGLLESYREMRGWQGEE